LEKFFVEFSASKIATGTPHEAHWTKNSLKLEFLTFTSCDSNDVPSQCPHFSLSHNSSPLLGGIQATAGLGFDTAPKKIANHKLVLK
jgi:hypothetical protein